MTKQAKPVERKAARRKVIITPGGSKTIDTDAKAKSEKVKDDDKTG